MICTSACLKLCFCCSVRVSRLLPEQVVYTDHSMFSFADAACIHINKVFKFFVTHCNHCICVSHTHKENLVLRGALNPHQIAVINNAVVGLAHNLNIIRESVRLCRRTCTSCNSSVDLNGVAL